MQQITAYPRCNAGGSQGIYKSTTLFNMIFVVLNNSVRLVGNIVELTGCGVVVGCTDQDAKTEILTINY